MAVFVFINLWAAAGILVVAMSIKRMQSFRINVYRASLMAMLCRVPAYKRLFQKFPEAQISVDL
ncbi:MAG: hypothetical protein CMJ78_15365 [Planctomycetaceae bacterium]|nr:hypothetical protein [Planctomycetaceae bacterium]